MSPKRADAASSDFFEAANEYAEDKRLHDLFASMMQALLCEQPRDPVTFLHDFLEYPDTLKIIISGPPASGKGTQAKRIAKMFNVVHISTGDVLRHEIKERTELGVRAKEFIDQGRLVPDELVCNLVINKLNSEECKRRGWMLDGFPRTRAQAVFLQQSGSLANKFISIAVDDDVVIQRACGRRLDPETGEIYHVDFHPAPTQEIADRLVIRSDDTVEKMTTRLATFHRTFDSIREFYSDIEYRVSGHGEPDAVFKEVRQFLEVGMRLPPSVPRKPPIVFVAGPPLAGAQRIACQVAKLLGLRFLPVTVPTFMDRLMTFFSKELGCIVGGFPCTTESMASIDSFDLKPDRVIYLKADPAQILSQAEVLGLSTQVSEELRQWTMIESQVSELDNVIEISIDPMNIDASVGTAVERALWFIESSV